MQEFMIYSNFTHNCALTGGGIYTRNNSTLVVYGGNFFFNNATFDAGAILSDQSNVVVYDGEFGNNSAQWGGAIVAYEKASVALDKCILQFNTGIWGGSLATHMGTLTINRSIFVHQFAVSEGGVAYINSGVLILKTIKLRLVGQFT